LFCVLTGRRHKRIEFWHIAPAIRESKTYCSEGLSVERRPWARWRFSTIESSVTWISTSAPTSHPTRFRIACSRMMPAELPCFVIGLTPFFQREFDCRT
jgi:hypothetical protein